MSVREDLERQNQGVKSWFSTTFQEIKNRYMRLIRSAHRSGDGFERLRSYTKSTFGEVDRGGFRFDRHLVFVHKGAGRGQGGSKGSSWLDKSGHRKSTNPLSFGKMDTGKRHKEEWLNPVLDAEVPKLANIVAGFKADAAVKQVQIK